MEKMVGREVEKGNTVRQSNDISVTSFDQWNHYSQLDRDFMRY